MIKNRLFTLTNILGLSIGIAFWLLIFLYVQYERSFDNFHEKGDNIYRLRYQRTSKEGKNVQFASACPPAAPALKANYPEIINAARIYPIHGVVLYNNIKFFEERIFYAESELFDIFTIKLLKGNPETVLKKPNTAILSQSMATKYFGEENPLGKTFSINRQQDFLVTGIFESLPKNSHVRMDILLSFPTLVALRGPEIMESWGYTLFYTYLLLKPGTDPDLLESKFPPLIKERVPWLKEYQMIMELKLQPLRDIHLTSHYMQELEANGNERAVNFLFIIAFFVVFIAWVNYINLSTARAMKRAREVGMRKVVGASRLQLMFQFFVETMWVNILAIFLALILVEIAKPLFVSFTGVPPEINIWGQSWFFPSLLVLFFTGVIFSGLYPVLVQSSFQPHKVLKQMPLFSQRGINLRRLMVLLQFAIALVLITGTFTIYKQLNFLQSQPLGFDMEQVLVLRAPKVVNKDYDQKLKSFKDILKGYPDIKLVSFSSEVPGRQILWDAGGIRPWGTDLSKSKNYQIIGMDYNFFDLYGLKLVAGRNFSKDFPSDKTALILTETGIKWMGLESPEKAVNQLVDYWGKKFTIIGVAKDFHQQSLKEAFEPHLFRFMTSWVRGRISVKMSSKNISNTVDKVKKHWQDFFPGNPFDYFFLEDYYDQQYESDRLFGNVFGIFALLALVVMLLGIFGLSSFIATQRTKEISIRKVLGASVPKIVVLLFKDFTYLILLAQLVCLPIALWGVVNWLNSFANRFALDIWLFLLPLIIVLAVTFGTVGFHILKAAKANPAIVLKYE
jgi:putative ABC transport system permease protein